MLDHTQEVDRLALLPSPTTPGVPASPTPAFRTDRGFSIEATIGAWLAARARAERTQCEYRAIITAFRAHVQAHGLDLLFHAPDFAPTVADLAVDFARRRAPRATRRGKIATATEGQRLAALSSYYGFTLIKRGHLGGVATNPIDLVDRPHVLRYQQAHALEQPDVAARLAAIDTRHTAGKRDLAMLALLLSTSRRVHEVAALDVGHLEALGAGAAATFRVYYPHAKGGQQALVDVLAPAVALLLSDYLSACYGCPVADIPPEAPLWVQTYHAATRGQRLGYHAFSLCCARVLGTSKVHATRHTAVALLLSAGAEITEVSKILGHASVATTNEYVEALRRDVNPFAASVAAALGLPTP